MKKYKDIGVYDFSDYAEEITGDDLIKINGGSTTSCNGGGPKQIQTQTSAPTKTTATTEQNETSEPIAATQPAENDSDTTLRYIGETTTPALQPASREAPDEVKANSQSYAYYMAKQGEALGEGNPNKYKNYNAMGTKSKTSNAVEGEDIRTYVLVVRQNDGLGNSFDSDRYVYKNGVLVFHDKVGANCKAEKQNENCFTEPDGEYYFTTEGLIDNGDGTFDSDSYHNVLIHQTNDPNISKEIRDKINISPRDFLEHCNQFKISASLGEDSGRLYGSNVSPCSAGCTIGKDGQEHQDLYMSVLLKGVSDVTNIRKEIRSISNIGR